MVSQAPPLTHRTPFVKARDDWAHRVVDVLGQIADGSISCFGVPTKPKSSSSSALHRPAARAAASAWVRAQAHPPIQVFLIVGGSRPNSRQYCSSLSTIGRYPARLVDDTFHQSAYLAVSPSIFGLKAKDGTGGRQAVARLAQGGRRHRGVPHSISPITSSQPCSASALS